MNILLINHYAGSPEMGMEFRPYYFAKEWIKSGHNVTILAADNSHLRKKNISIPKSFTEEIIDGIKYIWIKTPQYSSNGLSRVMNIFSFVLKTYYKAKYLSKHIMPDVVIASSTYTIDNYVARKISKISNAKHVYEVHDLWPLSPMELGNMSRFHPFIVLLQHGENYAYKHSDLVISMLPNTKAHMKAHGLDLNKWQYIPNGIVTKDWESPDEIPPKLTELFDNLKQNNKFIVGYTGGHAISNALDTIIKAAKLLINNKDIVFVLVGEGVEKQNLINKAANLKNIIFCDSVPKNSIPTLLKKMDIVCFGTNKSKLYKYGISMNKMMDYMMAEKPILQYIDTEYDIIELSKSGITIETENPEQFAQKVIELKDMKPSKREAMGKNGRKFVMENHDYKVLAEKFIEHISF